MVFLENVTSNIAKNVSNFSDYGLNNSAKCWMDYASDEALESIELFKGYPVELLHFAAVCCILFMILGIPGNIITIVALAKYKKCHNATALFIMSLAFSDLLLCCFNLPLMAISFWNETWSHGRLLCRIYPLTKYSLVAISTLTVMAITLNRYVLIAHPTLYPKLYSKRNLIYMLLMIWLFPFIVLLPTWFGKWGQFGMDVTIGSCSILRDCNNNCPKKYLFLGLSIFPALTVIISYARIFYIVKKATRQFGKTKVNTKALALRMPADMSSNEAKTSRSTSNIPNITSSSHSVLAGRSQSSKESILDDTYRKSGRRFNTISLRIKSRILPTSKDKKLRTMIVAITIAFCICYFPITITKIFQEFVTSPVLNIIAYILIFLTTCINPLIYVVMSVEYRQAYKNLSFRC